MQALRALAATALLGLAACAPAPHTVATPANAASADAESTARPPVASATDPLPAPPPGDAASALAPEPGTRLSTGDASAPASSPADGSPLSPSTLQPSTSPSLACRTDADCSVKDVGSCCGYRPACVNADAETFPEQVRARCAAEGRVGMCGFRPVSGCQCVSGRCSARPDDLGPAPPRELQ